MPTPSFADSRYSAISPANRTDIHHSIQTKNVMLRTIRLLSFKVKRGYPIQILLSSDLESEPIG